ncbi:unnamed protein product [Orchesella dallaii]|uniref:RNA helicase n=1 Tax=Orchesella dallaii TaxID=48710 RepID=A0ABP1QQU6_9HEXA
MASNYSNWVDAADEQEKALANQVENIAIAGKNGSEESPAEAPTNDPDDPVAEIKTEDKDLPASEKSLLQKLLRTKLVQSSKQLEIIQKDPTSPLFSATSFEDLPLRPELKKGVYAMGFNAPSRIQESALPILLSEPPQNLIAQSQSGTGKTAAFVLAMLSRVNPALNYPQVLCLSPTYELAIQTGKVVEQMGKFCPEIKVRFAIRQESVPQGTKLTEHIIIGTPGKVTDWAFRTRCFDLGKIAVFCLDEADVMIATQGYHDQSIKIHRSLKNCQTMLFSATYDIDVMRFAEKLIPDATVMRLKREEESLDNIKQYYIECNSPEDKYQAIATIYGFITVGGAMIFCQTRRTATWLATKLVKDGHSVALLHGELDVSQRIDVLNRFRGSHEKILITTNVMARGIDVEQVTLVVNYDLPTDMNHQADCETYLHRIGRTGRFGKMGIAINLVDGPKTMVVLSRIRDHFGKPIHKLNIDDVTELEQLES